MQEKKPLKNLKIKKVSIVGVIPSFAFQRAKYCALELHRKLPQRFPLPEIVGLLELDWSEKLQEWRQTLGREYWCLRRPVAVFFDDRFIGSDVELIKLVTIGNILVEHIPRKNMSSMKKHFRKDYISYLRKSKRVYCYLDICVDEVYAGTLTFQLYSDVLPRTCENFETLCLGSRGPLLSYRGSRIHRIVKKGWLQGGDIQYKTGGGGFSIFCDPLEDECFGISHDRRGVLSMASGGRHGNASQFFITLQPSKWMDTHFVAFGQLVEGVKVLRMLENLETFYECPLKKVEIKSCGKLDLEDVDDVDLMYKEEPMAAKKRKKIETLSEQVVRLILEALTEALARKEHMPDILDEGDVPSKMNLQLYFQGFYSLPESVLEETAAYLRKLRRQLIQVAKPNATEIVEVIMCDLLMAVLTRMTTLDEVRETIGHELYQKMISGIDMKLELCQKSYVRRLVDQIVSTAENMVNLVAKKIERMKERSQGRKKFVKRMQDWVQSFVLQETFKDDNYFIAERNADAKDKQEEKPAISGKPRITKPGRQCCEEDSKEKEEELKAKLRAKYPPEDLCCLGSRLHLSKSEINLYEFFSTCRYDLKKVPNREEEEEDRMPLLDLIEISRFKLRFLRHQENRMRDRERLSTDRKIMRWLSEVVYTPETSWLKESVFPKDCLVNDHVEEIMYGAMTAGLLEMYYFMERYLKLCGGAKKMLVTRTIYPEDSDDNLGAQVQTDPTGKSLQTEDGVGEEEITERRLEEITERRSEEITGQEVTTEQGTEDKQKGEDEEVTEDEGTPAEKQETERPACTCGHPCCKCEYDPAYVEPPPPPPSLIEGDFEEEEGEGLMPDSIDTRRLDSYEKTEEDDTKDTTIEETEQSTGQIMQQKPCASDETLVDLNALMAEKASLNQEEIDIKSFKWLKPYILEKGCDLKTEFATQVHKWLEGETFCHKGFISKHSLVTRASLLSLSLSLADLIKEENDLKKEVKNFVYDLWDLYFAEMFKEALLEFPPEEVAGEEEEDRQPGKEGEGKKGDEGREGKGGEEEEERKDGREEKEAKDGKEEKEGKEGEAEAKRREEGNVKMWDALDEDECKKALATAPDFDFEKFCAKLEEGEPQEQADMGEEEKPENTQNLEASPQNAEEEATPPRNEPEEGAEPPTEEPVAAVAAEAGEGETNGDGDAPKNQEQVKKKKSPIVIQELVEVSSGEEVRKMPPYVRPFWVKFLTELTKQALGAIAKVSRLPRRLFSQSDSEVAFDDKMKEWFEFNAFNPQPTKGREIMDYIALHHSNVTNLEDSARSYLKKKKLSGLLNRCTRFDSAEDMAGEIVTDVLDNAIEKTEENETLELFVSNLLSSAVTGTPERSQASFHQEEDEDFNTFETDKRESVAKEEPEDHESV